MDRNRRQQRFLTRPYKSPLAVLKLTVIYTFGGRHLHKGDGVIYSVALPWRRNGHPLNYNPSPELLVMTVFSTFKQCSENQLEPTCVYPVPVSCAIFALTAHHLGWSGQDNGGLSDLLGITQSPRRNAVLIVITLKALKADCAQCS